QAVLRAVLCAARHCDNPMNAPTIAEILARDHYLGVPADIIRTSLPGAAAQSEIASPPAADVSVFFANAATFPWRSHALWFLREMVRWGYLGSDIDMAEAAAIFRPDIYATAAGELGLPVPTTAIKSEGHHAANWMLPATSASIT